MIGSDGNSFFAYVDQFAIRSAHCGDSNCSPANITKSVILLAAAPYNTTAGYTAVTKAINGMPLVAFQDSKDKTLKVASCNDLSCESSVITLIAGNSDNGYPSIAVGSDGIPVLSFYDEKRHNLQFVRCNDNLCRNGTFTPIIIDDSSSDIGRYNGIQVGTDGLPIMMYVDETNVWMKVAHCNSIDCSGAVTKTIVDEIGISAYGEFPEIQINPLTGLAVLSYFNQTNHTSGSLKTTQCLNLECTDSIVQVIANGNCGYGRDSSIAFTSTGYVYVSFMNYSPIARLRKTSLAILQQNLTATPALDPHHTKKNFKERNNQFTTEDICKYSYGHF